MENLYIRLKSNQPLEHPILESNLLTAFPEVDINNLPQTFAKFKRVPQPSQTEMPVGIFQVAVCAYQLDADGVSYTDVWSVRDMSDIEKADTIAEQTKSVNTALANLQTLAAEKISETDGDVQISWQNYLNALNSLTITDPFIVEWPQQPQ